MNQAAQLRRDPIAAAVWQMRHSSATPLGWERVQAICDYVHQHIVFGPRRAGRRGMHLRYKYVGVCQYRRGEMSAEHLADARLEV